MRGSNSVVESQPSKLLVAGSIPVSRSSLRRRCRRRPVRGGGGFPAARAVARMRRAILAGPVAGFVIGPM